MRVLVKGFECKATSGSGSKKNLSLHLAWSTSPQPSLKYVIVLCCRAMCSIHPTTYIKLSSFCIRVSESSGRPQQSVAEVLRVHVEVAAKDHDVRPSRGVAEARTHTHKKTKPSSRWRDHTLWCNFTAAKETPFQKAANWPDKLLQLPSLDHSVR